MCSCVMSSWAYAYLNKAPRPVTHNLRLLSLKHVESFRRSGPVRKKLFPLSFSTSGAAASWVTWDAECPAFMYLFIVFLVFALNCCGEFANGNVKSHRAAFFQLECLHFYLPRIYYSLNLRHAVMKWEWKFDLKPRKCVGLGDWTD